METIKMLCLTLLLISINTQASALNAVEPILGAPTPSNSNTQIQEQKIDGYLRDQLPGLANATTKKMTDQVVAGMKVCVTYSFATNNTDRTICVLDQPWLHKKTIIDNVDDLRTPSPPTTTLNTTNSANGIKITPVAASLTVDHTPTVPSASIPVSGVAASSTPTPVTTIPPPSKP